MPVTVDLPLPKDPTLRAKQVLNTLLAGPVDAELRTLPPDAVLLAFYMLPDGTAIADFSEALATATPSGIESEQMAVDSITEDPGSECAAGAVAEDFDPWAGSGYLGGAFGFDADVSGECEGGADDSGFRSASRFCKTASYGAPSGKTAAAAAAPQKSAAQRNKR